MACRYGSRCHRAALEVFCGAHGIQMPVKPCPDEHPTDLTPEKARRLLTQSCRRDTWLRLKVAKDAVLFRALAATPSEGRTEVCRYGSRCTRRALTVLCTAEGIESPCNPCFLAHKNGEITLDDAREALSRALECPTHGQKYRAHLEKTAPDALAALSVHSDSTDAHVHEDARDESEQSYVDVVRHTKGLAIRPPKTVNNVTVSGHRATVNIGHA